MNPTAGAVRPFRPFRPFRQVLGVVCALAVATGGGRLAAADEPAPPKKVNAMTLKKGALNLIATFEANLSKDAVLEPFSIAPDVAYGVSNELTVTVGHSGFMSTGFRGSAGGGLCLAGTDGGCAHGYDNLGAEALYSLVKGPLAAAVVGGFYGAPLDPLWMQVKVGLKARLNVGKLYVTWLPSVFVGVNDRDTSSTGAPGNKGSLWSPFGLGFKPNDKLALTVGAGFKGPLDGFADKFTIAAGVIGQYTIDKQLGVGASLFFPKVAGASALPDAATGFDFRFVQIWLSYTR